MKLRSQFKYIYVAIGKTELKRKCHIIVNNKIPRVSLALTKSFLSASMLVRKPIDVVGLIGSKCANANNTTYHTLCRDIQNEDIAVTSFDLHNETNNIIERINNKI